MRAWISAINFHDGASNASFNFVGSRGYQLPQGRASVSVDFQIEESEDSVITLTQVLTGEIHSYDDLAKFAYQQFVDRLGNLGALSLRLSASFDREQPKA